MIEKVYLLFEVLAMMLGLWTLHGSKKKPGIAAIIYVFAHMIIMASVELEWLPAVYSNLLYLGLIVLCIFEFEDRIYESCIYVIVNTALVGAVQIVCGMFICLLFENLYTGVFINFLINAVTCAIMALIFWKVKLHKYVELIIKSNIIGKLILLGGIIACAYMMWLTKIEMKIYWRDAVLITSIVIFVFAVVFQWQNERWSNKQREEELKAYEKYNLIYKDLISEVRRRQHDFTNHIQAVFSMNMFATDLDKLIREQNEYCSKIMLENTTNKLLREDIPSVLAGFLYTKISQAEKENIQVKYRINISDIEKRISFSELVEILGNLFDNAIEANRIIEEKNKKINFFINQGEESLMIEISNPYCWEGNNKMDDMIEEGKSTKGNRRGLGLANVTEIVEKYHGIFEVKNLGDGDEEFIVFRIHISLI